MSSVTRPFTNILREAFETAPLVGAEIGFGFGANAANLLRELNLTRLYCVDPLAISDSVETGRKVDEYVLEMQSRGLLNELTKDQRVTFLKMTSDEAFNNHLPKDLDFVYIDGNHDYEFVKRDLSNAFQHVRKGGYVGGHDFSHPTEGVVRAVIEHAVNLGNVPTTEIADYWFKVNGTSS